MSELKPEHGTLQAYITGFVLSLVFTFIPYYLVVNHITRGTTLLSIILGFGVLQMLVQLLFFLHLGRRPRPHWQIIFLISTVGAVLVVVAGSLIIINNLHHHMAPSDQVKQLVNDEGIYEVNGHKTGACQGQHTNHRIMLMDNVATPAHVQAAQCDTLTFMNHDGSAKVIAFGKHPGHAAYAAGVSEYTIRAGQNKTITLSETGTYTFHDHLHPETTGSLTISK